MSSTAIQHAAPAAQLTGTVATAQVWAQAANNNLAVTLAIPGKLRLEGKRFSVRAEGNCQVAGATTTVNATLLGALTIPTAPLTAANWTTLKAGTAATIAAAGGWAPWYCQADLIFDSQSGLLTGTFSQLANNALTAAAAITTLSGINGTNQSVVQAGPVTVVPADPVAYLAIAFTFGTAGANIGNLMNFELAF
jgi:hypothetical protein